MRFYGKLFSLLFIAISDYIKFFLSEHFLTWAYFGLKIHGKKRSLFERRRKLIEISLSNKFPTNNFILHFQTFRVNIPRKFHHSQAFSWISIISRQFNSKCNFLAAFVYFCRAIFVMIFLSNHSNHVNHVNHVNRLNHANIKYPALKKSYLQ